MILPKVRDPRFITVRRGGSLSDAGHRLLALWAADCAEHVLHHFELARPDDDRPRRAIDQAGAWARGETSWQARMVGFAANAAARDVKGAARGRHTLRVRPLPWATLPPTSSAPPPTRLGLCGRRPRRTNVSRPDDPSAAATPTSIAPPIAWIPPRTRVPTFSTPRKSRCPVGSMRLMGLFRT